MSNIPTEAEMNAMAQADQNRLVGLAEALSNCVSAYFALTHKPVPMAQIRQMAQQLVTNYTEHHFYQHAEWFTRFMFPDGSSITWGEME